MPYDIIGDIHGYAGALRSLLERMGYRERDGAYRHPGRTAIFVGDFIDRGPNQLETVKLARSMVDAGSALAVMGNHELNAIAWHTRDPEGDDDYMRSHLSPKHRKQHEAFLAEVEGKPVHDELVDWFLTLPLWLDLPEIRIVHACWHAEHMERLAPRLDSKHRLTREVIVSATRKGMPEYAAVECLTKGLEIDLPAGHSFRDSDGHERDSARVRWWNANATTYRDALVVPDGAREQLPEGTIPAYAPVLDDDARPTFVGHYWESGIPEPYSNRVACVDYSAGKGGALVAYRWDGETELRADKFVASRVAGR